jgi:hypothetical protein
MPTLPGVVSEQLQCYQLCCYTRRCSRQDGPLCYRVLLRKCRVGNLLCGFGMLDASILSGQSHNRPSLLLVFPQLHLMSKTLESIISKPLVQKSRESNVPAWLLFPIAGCASYGALYAFSTTSGLNTRAQGRNEASWIGPLFMTAGGRSIVLF